MIKYYNLNKCEDINALIESEEWPDAVLNFQIIDDKSEEDKLDRAEGIIDILMEESLTNKSFLDFGCGEGHLVKYVAQEATKVAGYDIVSSGSFKWETQENNSLLSTDFIKIKENGPYDIIFIYDVIDHTNNSVGVLKKARAVLKDNGIIYLRCHPWCSRHAGHLYRQINKAFIHLILSEQELIDLGFSPNFKNINKVMYPLKQYHQYIEDSNLKIKKMEIDEQDVESFFKNNKFIKNRILNLFEKINWTEGCPVFQMKQNFVDYILEK